MQVSSLRAPHTATHCHKRSPRSRCLATAHQPSSQKSSSSSPAMALRRTLLAGGAALLGSGALGLQRSSVATAAAVSEIEKASHTAPQLVALPIPATS